MRKFVFVGLGCATLALAACSTDSGKFDTGNFWVQPGKYDFLKCPDLARLSIADSTREKQLVSLMERANQEAVGPVVNLMVYRADLEQVRADLALVARTAREKGCDSLVPSPQNGVRK
jgi:hypothetical protein